MKEPLTCLSLTFPSYLKFSSGYVFSLSSVTVTVSSISFSGCVHFHVTVVCIPACVSIMVVFQSLYMLCGIIF